jgi:hypothetical protein
MRMLETLCVQWRSGGVSVQGALPLSAACRCRTDNGEARQALNDKHRAVIGYHKVVILVASARVAVSCLD